MRMLRREDVRLLWHSRFWDYPRDGALEWDGQRYWFDETEFGSGVFNIMELTAEQWALQDAIHQDFQAYVGTHNDYTEPGNQLPIDVGPDVHNARLRPRGQWPGFYERWKGHTEQPRGTVVAQWKYDTGPEPDDDGDGWVSGRLTPGLCAQFVQQLVQPGRGPRGGGVMAGGVDRGPAQLNVEHARVAGVEQPTDDRRERHVAVAGHGAARQ
jgi:hypothetical protein